jgi:hypothetical protein
MTTFAPPNFVTGEMPTPNKLNVTAQQYASNSQAIATLVGNVFYNNIPNVGGSIGDVTKLTGASDTPSMPAIFNTNNPYTNIIRITLNAISPNYSALLRDSKLIAPANIIDGNVVNTVLVKLSGTDSITNPPYIVRAYNTTISGTVGNSTLTIQSEDGALDSDFLTSHDNFALITANQTLIDTIVQTLNNIGNMTFASGTSNTLTDEINSIENKMFYVLWQITLDVTAAVVTSDTGHSVRKWTWTNCSSIPSSNIALSRLASGAYLPNMLTTNDPYLLGSPGLSNDYLRPKCFFNGVPLLRPGSQTQTLTGYKATYIPARIDSGNIYILTDDISNITTGTITLYVPVHVPFKFLDSSDLSNRLMLDMWNGFMTKVIGASYFQPGPPLSPIDERLTSLTNSANTILEGLENLTSLHDSNPSLFDPPNWPSI